MPRLEHPNPAFADIPANANPRPPMNSAPPIAHRDPKANVFDGNSSDEKDGAYRLYYKV